jgi:hypothetical protein
MRLREPADYLGSKLDDQRMLIIETMIQGKLDEGEYRRLCGVLQGLDFAKNLINDLAKRLEDADE